MQRFASPTYLRSLLLLVLLLAVTGCSSQLAYRFADTYIAWKIRDYVDLNGDQRDQVDVAVDNFLQWHAETEMPQYLLLIDELSNDVAAQNFSAPRVAYYQHIVAQRWAAIRLAAVQPALKLLPALNDEQVAELIENIAENIQSRADEFAEQSTEERREESIESVQEVVERLMGRVNQKQQTAIAAWSQAMPDMTSEWIEYRVTWAEAFRSALQQRDNAAEFEAALRPLFEKPRALRSEQALQKSAAAQAVSQSMVLSIVENADAPQRAHMRSELADLADDLRGMMRTRDAEPAS